MNNCLANLNLANKQCYIIGDVNINTLCNNYQESLAKKHDLISKSNGCLQTITAATITTTCSKTLLDHIITNESELQITLEVFNYQISDHSLIFVMLKNTQCSSQKRNNSETVEKQKFRCFSDYETAKFVEELKLKLENHFNQIPEITPANFNEEFDIQGVHKVRVHFKKFITLFLCTIEIICKKDLKEVNRYFVMFC